MAAHYGYAGKILKVDLSAASITEIPTMNYADKFLGGRGIAARIYWEEVLPEVKPFDAENRLIFATGPLGGVPVIGGSRWVVCGKSPLPDPESFCYCNLGGTWGAELKFAGYDAIVVHGKSEKPVFLFVHDDIVEFKDASALWGRGAVETLETLKEELGKSVRVVTIGPAGENMAIMATLLADHDASGGGGLGATMGSKKLKAIVVKGTGKKVEIAQPDRFHDLTSYYRELKRVLIRVSPFRWSPDSLTDIQKLPPGTKIKMDRCYGCFTGCGRAIYEAEDGKKGKFLCAPALSYQPRSLAYYGEWNDVPFYASRLVNDYGLDSEHVDPIIDWLERCFQAGILTDENTGIPISKVGSLEFIETLIRKIALREDFGDTLADGLEKAGEVAGPRANELVSHASYSNRDGYNCLYSPRLYITNALLYAMEPRIPIQELHEIGSVIGKWLPWARGLRGGILSSDSIRAIARTFWGSEVAGDFSTYEGKALAAKMIQDRQYVKESLILCDFLWPITDLANTQDYLGDPSLESKLVSAVTGNEVDEEGLNEVGERIFNLQRAILTREGRRGREFDRLPEKLHTIPEKTDYFNIYSQVPGKGGEIISRVGEVVDREEFEKMKSEYYEIRQWDVPTGLQTWGKLDELGLKDVGEDLDRRGLIVKANQEK